MFLALQAILLTLGVYLIYFNLAQNISKAIDKVHFREKIQPRKSERRRFSEAILKAKAEGYIIGGFYHSSAWRAHWKLIIEEQLKILDGKRSVAGDDGIDLLNAPANIEWSESIWASLMQSSEFLYMNIAGKERSDFEMISSYVKTLGLKNQNKIIFKFNRTIDRNSFVHKNSDEQKILLDDPDNLSEGEVSTIYALHDYCKRTVAAGKKSIVYYLHSKSANAWPRLSKKSRDLPTANWRDVMNAFTIEFPSICLRAIVEGYSTCG